MAVSNTTVKTLYTGNDSNTTFAIPFDFKDSTEISVIVRDESVTPATETTQTLGVDYTLTGSPATDVEFTVAPASTDKVLVIRVNPLTQATDYNENSAFPAESHEDALDKSVRIAQELDEVIDRALKMKQTLSGFDPTIPDPDTGTSVLSVNAGLNGLEWRDFTTTDAGLATQAEAEGGSNNATFLSPLRGYQQNTARIASKVQAEAGTDNDKLMTPLRVKEFLNEVHSLENIGITQSSAAGAITISLSQADGTAPSSSGPARVKHMNSPLDSASFRILSYTSTESLTIPSGGTLNAGTGVSFVYVYSIYDGTNLELAVAGASGRFNNLSNVSTTQLDTNSDDKNTLYSTTARTNCTVKLIGRLKWDNLAVEGTWVDADEIVTGDNIETRNGYYGKNLITIDYDNVASIFSHVFLSNGFLKCNGNLQFNGTPTTGSGVLTLPSEFTPDAKKFAGYSPSEVPIGQSYFNDSGLIYPGQVVYNNATSVRLKYYKSSGSGAPAQASYYSLTLPVVAVSGDRIGFNFEIPIIEI